MITEKIEKGNNGAPIGQSPLPLLHGSMDENDVAEPVARLVPMALCVAALVVMLKNSDSNDFGFLSYSDLGAFRYLVHANGIICAEYSLLTAIIAAMPRPFTMSQAWTFFFLDQVLTYLALAAGAAAAEVLFLEEKGDSKIWHYDSNKIFCILNELSFSVFNKHCVIT